MSHFLKILSTRTQHKHNGQPLWKYNLSDKEYEDMRILFTQSRSFFNIDPRDCTLYFAEWWKRNYNGGSPKIQDVFNSLGRLETNIFDAKSFYEIAKKGAEILGIKWIQKQNTLKLRTLLLQGGIPVNHISANKSYYQAFLLKLIELQPNSVEQISLQSDLTKLLPTSSQNRDIYENCLEVIQSILNDEDTYTALFESNTGLKEIRTALQIRKHQLSKTPRIIRPKIFWVMQLNDGMAKIYLRMGFGNKYTAASLSDILNLEEPANERTYHLYLDESLICSFRKTLGGDYKTEWETQKLYRWHPKKLSPQFHCICKDDRWEISDLITVLPTVGGPTLWTGYDDNEWRLVKGNAINSMNALLLLPMDWQHSTEANNLIIVDEYSLKAIQFEGEVHVSKEGTSFKFSSNVDSFEWNIRSEKPLWMRKAAVTILTRLLKLDVYDKEDKIVAAKSYKVHFKSASSNHLWQLWDGQKVLPIGLVDVKVEYNDVTAYDTAYNIGELKLEVVEQKMDYAILKLDKHYSFNITIADSTKFSASIDSNKFCLKLNPEQLSIPDSIPFTLKHGNQKTLHFDIAAPFSGVGLVDKSGTLVKEGSIFSLNDLHGIRILTTDAGETTIRLWNKLRDQVKISKIIQFTHYPLISFKEELQRLFYLADAMKHDNHVMIDISNGKIRRNYYVKGFSHTINNTSTQLERKVMIAGENEHMQLYAVPLNCQPKDIDLVAMKMNADNYHILPESVENGQFIIISETLMGNQLQPRFPILIRFMRVKALLNG